MHISLTSSRANGFKKWSDANRPSNDDDNPGGATPIAVTEPPVDDCGVIEEPNYQLVSECTKKILAENPA